MTLTQLHEDQFTMRSWGNGLMIEIEDKRTGESVFFQDEDAARFTDEWDHWQMTMNDDFQAFMDSYGYLELIAA